MHIKQYLAFSFLILLFSTLSLQSTAQTTNKIFYIEDSGEQSVHKLKLFDIDQDSTYNILNSSILFAKGYHIPDEDSLLLFSQWSKDVYKSDRDFSDFRVVFTLDNDDNEISTSIDLENNTLYYASNKIWDGGYNIKKVNLTTWVEEAVANANQHINAVGFAANGKLIYTQSDKLLLMKEGENEIDTLMTGGTSNFIDYSEIVADAAGENIYITLEKNSSYNIMRLNLQTKVAEDLYESNYGIKHLKLDETNDRLLVVTEQESGIIYELDLNNLQNGLVQKFNTFVQISAVIMDTVKDVVLYNTTDAVIEINIDTNEGKALTVPTFSTGALALDVSNEWLYIITESVPHRVFRTNFSGSEVSLIKELDVYGTTFRRIKLDPETNDLYLLTNRRLYKTNLNDQLPEETLLELGSGNKMVGFDMNFRDNLIYYYLDQDGIYQSDMNGENYTKLTDDGYYYAEGIAFDSDSNKVYFGRTEWIDQVYTDGSGVSHFHQGFNGAVTDIQYDSNTSQFLFITENSTGTDFVRFRRTDMSAGEDMTGFYLAAPSIQAMQFMLSSDGPSTSTEELSFGLPKSTKLEQNYPNPFNPVTVIKYQVVNQGNVSLDVYDMTGRKVESLVNKTHSPGTYQITFNAANLASGMYLYRLTAGHETFTKKLMLVK